MKAPMVVTDLTRMQGGNVCIGGYLRDYTSVRPVIPFKGLAEEWLYVGKNVIRPFAVVQFDFLSDRPEPPHTEDRAIHPTYRDYQQLLPPERRQRLLARIDDGAVTNIFGADVHHEGGWYVQAGEGARSLGTIKPAVISEVRYATRPVDRWDYRITFTDVAGETYRLAVTDLAFRYLLDFRRVQEGMLPPEIAATMMTMLQNADVFLRIGLTRGGRDPDRCYLQITGVYSFPDYLDGRCFADLTPPPVTPPHPIRDEDIPF